MGQAKVSSLYDKPDEAVSFLNELIEDVGKLEYLIENNKIESDIQRIGAEQEFCFVDQYYRPSPVIMDVLNEVDDAHFTVEHARFNGEINLDPYELKAGCFKAFERELKHRTTTLRKAAALSDSDIILTGILPTIGRNDLKDNNLTPKERFMALSSLRNIIRGEPYEFRIEGVDQFIDRYNTSMFEACNTSFQVHLQLSAEEIVDAYNWSQAIAGPVLSCCTNSPILFGKRLWRETRIALFQQSVDTRSSYNTFTERIPRVSFGTRWIEDSIAEVFKEDIVRHAVLLGGLPATGTEELPDAPKLRALSIHNGTIYRWNRPCYGLTHGKPHLRIECRYLPAGPTMVDEVANSVFWVGLMKGLPEKYKDISSKMDFDDARSNFIKAARMGLGAQFKWMNGQRIPSKQLILNELLPIAREGLDKAKIPGKEYEPYLDIIQKRVESERTGSQWLRDAFSTFKKDSTTQDALLQSTAGLIRWEKQNIPVHLWDKAAGCEVTDPEIRYHWVDQIMSEDLVIAHLNDPVNFLSSIMDWKGIHHILVVDGKGRLIGLISKGLIDSLPREQQANQLLAKDIMVKEPVYVTTETEIGEARHLMTERNIGSLPVVDGEKIVGIITKSDMNRLTVDLK
ncbi:CBS domain-containing protein [Roseivirga sp.]|uniref:CBS domain-containing protein n=1 Tax=Roseivirga sp. TaxID=1964215 RepID=UPI003B52CD2E